MRNRSSAINRTSVELKRVHLLPYLQSAGTINRTSVELKLRSLAPVSKKSASINRTSVELKHKQLKEYREDINYQSYQCGIETS